MKLPALARISIVLLVVAGCAAASPGASPAPTQNPTSAVVATTATTPTPPPASASTPATTPPETAPPATSDQPPAAALGTGDFAVTGQLGSYCWGASCVDTAGFYKSRLPAITVAESDELVFSMEDGEFAGWTASYGPDVEAPTVLGQGGQEVDPDVSKPSFEPLTFAEFDAPPLGDWIVAVFVRFGDGGDAAYGWHVTVE
jgi:hypothetical protein